MGPQSPIEAAVATITVVNGALRELMRGGRNNDKREKAIKADAFEQSYPNVAWWVRSYGWIEMGDDDVNRSFVRALDIGGMIWEGKDHYASVDEALADLEAALAHWFAENG